MHFLTRIEGHTLWAPGLSRQSVVLDLGANKGNFSRGILQRFHCRCYAVEANPNLCGIIPRHPRLKAYNLAMAATSGKLPLHLSANPEASSILTPPANDRCGTVEVQGICIQDFLNRAGLRRVDLIKFDIEGAEIGVLDSSPDDLLKSIGQLSIEFHDFLGLTPEGVVKRVVGRLEALGFYTLKMWRRAWGDTLFVNRAVTAANPLALAWSRHVTRNWWGLERVSRRTAGALRGRS